MKISRLLSIFLICFQLMCSLSCFAQPLVFTTLAGSASVGSTDGAGSAARFNLPQGVAVDAAGNAYVADSGNDTIRMIAPGGAVTTVAGQVLVKGSADGVGTNALFNLPTCLVLDASGNMYVLDVFNDTIRKLTLTDTTWSVITLAGQAGVQGYSNGTGTNAQFCTPAGLAIDGAGNLYVGDQCNHVIRKVTPDGTASTLAGQPHHPGNADGTNGTAQFYGPSRITVDSATNLFVTDAGSTIRRLMPVGPDWVVTTVAGQFAVQGSTDGAGTNALFNAPGGIAVDSNENVYVSDTDNDTIRRMTLVGTNWVVSTVAGAPLAFGGLDGTNGSARFHFPGNLATAAGGKILVADINNNCIRTLALSGTNAIVTTLAGQSTGSADGPASSALFWNTEGIALDAGGNAYVADFYNATIRKISTNGIVSTIAGSPGSPGSSDGTNGDARFDNPFNLVVDNQGNIFVTDTYNSVVRKMSPVGTNWVVTTIAGQAGNSGVSDGPGGSALFYVPTGIAIDAGGNLYVTDNYGMTVRKLAPVGTNWNVSTIAGKAGTTGYADGTGTNALFYFPRGLAVDSATNVYVADSENNAIRKLTQVGSNWVVTTIAGFEGARTNVDGVGTNAMFYFPDDLAFDAAGQLFVVDTYDQTIRKMTLVGTNWVVTTVGGLAGATGSADGVGTNALFNYPQGIAVSGAGELYVADTYNSTIRVGHAPPTLHIVPSPANHVVLSWPGWATAFHLETAAALSPLPSWSVVSTTAQLAESDLVVTNNANSTNAFYRLHAHF